MSAKKRIPIRKIRAALQTHLRASERGRAAFKLSGDALDAAIALGAQVGVPIKLAKGRIVEVEDQFASKNIAFAAKAFNRFAVKDVRLPKRPAPAAAAPEGSAQ